MYPGLVTHVLPNWEISILLHPYKILQFQWIKNLCWSYSWRLLQGQGSSCNLHERAPSPESEQWNTPCPAQTSRSLSHRQSVSSNKSSSCGDLCCFIWEYSCLLSEKNRWYFVNDCSVKTRFTCCSSVMTVCTRKFPLSQGSVMPTEPGRKRPAASICRQRLECTNT